MRGPWHIPQTTPFSAAQRGYILNGTVNGIICCYWIMVCCGEIIVEAQLRYLLKINIEAKPSCLFSKHQTVMQAKHIISLVLLLMHWKPQHAPSQTLVNSAVAEPRNAHKLIQILMPEGSSVDCTMGNTQALPLLTCVCPSVAQGGGRPAAWRPDCSQVKHQEHARVCLWALVKYRSIQARGQLQAGAGPGTMW